MKQTKKYHVTDDGDVYRINDDGSFTSMGNAEKMSEPQSAEAPDFNKNHTSSNEKPVKPFSQDKSRKRIWIYGIIFLLLITGGVVYFTSSSNQENTITNPNNDIMTNAYETDLTETTESKIETISFEEPKSSKEIESKHTQDLNPKLPHKVVSETTMENKEVQEFTSNESSKRKEIKNTNSIDPNKVYDIVDDEAEFPGGDRARLQWLRNHISWPRDENGQQLHGDVELDFIIERDGRISNVKVTYSENSGLNSAALALISSMPKWSPAMVKNQPVRSSASITLFF